MKTRRYLQTYFVLISFANEKAAAPNTERVERKRNVSTTIWRRKQRVSIIVINLPATVSQNFRFVRMRCNATII